MPRPSDKRTTLQTLRVSVDPTARPLLERIVCDLVIDHDYVAKATLRSTARGDVRDIEFHDFDFALALPRTDSGPAKLEDGSMKGFLLRQGVGLFRLLSVWLT